MLIGGYLAVAELEEAVDLIVRREEPRGLFGRLESLHLALSSACRPMGVLGAIIEVSAGPMTNLGQDQLNIPQAQAEDVTKPDCMTDDLGREAIAGGRERGLTASGQLRRSATSRLYAAKVTMPRRGC
jgi:hypothetical protein